MQNRQDFITTNEFAASIGVQGSTIRRGLCVNGHYLGVKPVKLPNGRLLWPRQDIDRLVGRVGEESGRVNFALAQKIRTVFGSIPSAAEMLGTSPQAVLRVLHGEKALSDKERETWALFLGSRAEELFPAEG